MYKLYCTSWTSLNRLWIFWTFMEWRCHTYKERLHGIFDILLPSNALMLVTRHALLKGFKRNCMHDKVTITSGNISWIVPYKSEKRCIVAMNCDLVCNRESLLCELHVSIIIISLFHRLEPLWPRLAIWHHWTWMPSPLCYVFPFLLELFLHLSLLKTCLFSRSNGIGVMNGIGSATECMRNYMSF